MILGVPAAHGHLAGERAKRMVWSGHTEAWLQSPEEANGQSTMKGQQATYSETAPQGPNVLSMPIMTAWPASYPTKSNAQEKAS